MSLTSPLPFIPHTKLRSLFAPSISLFHSLPRVDLVLTSLRGTDLPSSARLSLFSLYGMVTVIGRGGQVAALVFGNALCACAFKGWAVVTILLSLVRPPGNSCCRL